MRPEAGLLTGEEDDRPHAVHEKLMLIGADWRPRALLRAQLLEEGYDVTAIGVWDEAELMLRTRALVPDIVLFDLAGEPNPEMALETLARLAPGTRVLVLTSAQALSPERIAALGFPHVLARPFQVSAVVRTLANLVRGPRA